MGFSGQFFRVLGVDPGDRRAIADLARRTGIEAARLRHYNDANVLPTGGDLERILATSGLSEVELMLAMGRLSREVLAALQPMAREVTALLEKTGTTPSQPPDPPPMVLETGLGRLHQGDCLELMAGMESESVDMVFADPPFNLNKLYPSLIDDKLKTGRYLEWCEAWLGECTRILKHGGALFLWNLPKWNAEMAGFLSGRLTFAHWIAVDIKSSLPIQGRLYPSHYALLYFVKGPSARVFHPDRLPMQICPHCYGDLRDYGGYKDKMNPRGVNLSDVWWDLAPVRHAKYKRRNGANELPLKLLDRVIEIATDPGDLVFDPFGGAGTTYVAAEIKGRRWIGIEIGPTEDIERRFADIDQDRKVLADYRSGINVLFTDAARRERVRGGWWTCETVRSPQPGDGRLVLELE